MRLATCLLLILLCLAGCSNQQSAGGCDACPKSTGSRSSEPGRLASCWLPQPPFLRVHKSYIVSLDHVRLVDGNTLYIQDKLIPVSDTYREALYRLVHGS